MGKRVVDENGKTTIEESEMTFGPYPNIYFDALFELEESKIYKKIHNDGVASAEFLLHKTDNNHIWIIEAKSSAPQKSSHNLNKKTVDLFFKNERINSRNKSDFIDEFEKQVKHDLYFEAIKQKFNDTLALIAAISLSRHSDNSELPKNFSFTETTHFNLILVVKNHDINWLQDLQSRVEIKLKPLIKIWQLPANCVKVMNEQLAIKKGLISDNTLI